MSTLGLNFQTSPNLELVKTALDKLFDNTLIEMAVSGKATATDPVVFMQDSADKAAVVSTVIGGSGYFKKTVAGTANDLSTKKAAAKNAPTPKTTIIAEFNKDLLVTRSFMMDQQQSAVAKSVKQEAITWEASRDQNSFNAYALGFTTQTTIDSVALFSNSHVNNHGDTVDNLETGAMDDSTINTTVVSLRNQKNQDGVKVGFEPKFLLTSNASHSNGTRLTKSVLRAGSGNNDMNYWSDLYPGMKCVYNQFLDDTSTTAFFVGGTMHGVVRFEREAFFTELVDWKTDPEDQYKYKMRAREEVDTIEYTGLVGNTGV